MRVYLPSTLSALRAALDGGAVAGAPIPAFAVTPRLRAALDAADEEELEYAALSAAADASLSLLAADSFAPRRRVVLAAEVAEAVVAPPEEGDAGPAEVAVTAEVPLRRVVSAHVDDEAAADLIAAEVREPGAGHADRCELMWYASQELRFLS